MDISKPGQYGEGVRRGMTRRLLFEWRGIRLYSYPTMLYLGILFGLLAGTGAANAHGLDAAQVYGAMFLLVVPALAGARLLFIGLHWKLYRSDFSRIWRPSEGGAALYGGLIAVLAVSIPLLHPLGLPFWAFWDAASVAMLVGMIFTKVGCLLNGCCAGRSTEGPIALYLPNARGIRCRRVPAQLLEAVLAAALLFVAAVIRKWLPFDGALFLSILITYGMGRWALELAREDIIRIGRLSLNRLISASLAALSVAGLLLLGFHGIRG